MAQHLISAVALRGGLVEWTTVKVVKNGVEVVEHNAVELPGGADAANAEDFGQALKSACGHLKGDICLSVPADRTLMRVADLPTSDPAEVAGMVELQVDKFSPFPVEHMAVAYEQLSHKGASSRVLIATIQREIIENLGAGFRVAGILPRWIDVDVMGWWTLLKEKRELPETGRRVLLILDGDEAEMIICEDGIPLVVRSLGTPAGISEDEYHAELAEEIGYSLTSLEADKGTTQDFRIVLWHRGGRTPPKVVLPGTAVPSADSFSKLVAHLRDAAEALVEERSLDDLPPLSEGLARRAVTREGQMINLAPPGWKTEEQSRRTRKTLLIATAAFLAAWIAGVSVFAGGLYRERKKVAATRVQVELLEGPAAEVRNLQDKIQSFEAYADRTHSALEALREVSMLLPERVDITSFTFKKASTVSMRGVSSEADPVYDFFQALEQSEFFTKVNPGELRSKQVGAVQKSEFSVSCDLPGKEEKQ